MERRFGNISHAALVTNLRLKFEVALEAVLRSATAARSINQQTLEGRHN